MYFSVWINPNRVDELDLRLYLNEHTLPAKIFLRRQRFPKGTINLEYVVRAESMSEQIAMREAALPVVEKALMQYGCRLNKPHWWRLLLRAEWPYKYDREGILTDISKRLRKKKVDKYAQEKGRRRIIRE